jgi:hypothetical protein
METWFYIENPPDSTKKLLELINEISKLFRYRNNIHKSVVLLYVNSKLPIIDIHKLISFKITLKSKY